MPDRGLASLDFDAPGFFSAALVGWLQWLNKRERRRSALVRVLIARLLFNFRERMGMGVKHGSEWTLQSKTSPQCKLGIRFLQLNSYSAVHR